MERNGHGNNNSDLIWAKIERVEAENSDQKGLKKTEWYLNNGRRWPWEDVLPGI